MVEKFPDEHKQTAHAALRAHMDILLDLADNICKRHFDFVMAANKRKEWADNSVLYVKPRLRDNTLAVTWYVVRWYGSKALKTRRMEKKVIVKPRHKYGYNMETLLKQTKPWEVDMVLEVESELIQIRREATFIGDALGKLNQVLKASKAGEPE